MVHLSHSQPYKKLRKIGFRFKLAVLGNLRVASNLRSFRKQSLTSVHATEFEYGKKVKVLDDFYDQAGVASGHYFHQDLYVARAIEKANPAEHYDIGSRVDGFIAHLAVFRDVNVFDIRELESKDPRIEFRVLDIMNLESVQRIEKISSLSCLHTAEHFGLGRYGDPVNFDGWKIGLQNMTEMLKKGGIFYFSTPISNRQRIVFNAHRIFNPKFLTDFFLVDFEVLKTAAIRDSGDLDLKADFLSEEFLSGFRDEYACGIWILQKK